MDANIAILKNRLSRYLKAVQAGEEIVVLDRQRPIARIIPYRPASGPTERTSDADDALEAMVRRGALTHQGKPNETSAWVQTHRAAAPAAGSPALSDVLLQQRQEEPW